MTLGFNEKQENIVKTLAFSINYNPFSMKKAFAIEQQLLRKYANAVCNFGFKTKVSFSFI